MTPEELDKWAAEKVMGWSEIIPQYHAPMVYYGLFSDNVPTCACVIPKIQWHPTSDLNQAFMVVEKLEEMRAEVIVKKQETTIFYNGLWRYGRNEGRAMNTIKAAYAALGE